MARQILESLKSVLEFKERTRREEDAAYKFFVEHKDTLCSPENLGTASKIIRHRLEQNTLKYDRCLEMLKKAQERRKQEAMERESELRELDKITSSAPYLPSLGLMRPVSPETRRTLYEGISATGGGRAQYLKLRNRKDPEEKYIVKYPTSWDYGWYFSEMVKPDKIGKRFNRSDIIKNTLFGRNGIPLEDAGDIIQKKRFV